MSRDIYSPEGNGLIEVFNTTLFSDCYYCPKKDKIYQNQLTEITKEYFMDNFNTDRFNQIKRFALIKQAKDKITIEDLIKLGYYENL